MIPRELIENTQANSSDDIFNLDPFTQSRWPVNRGNPFSVSIRGFSSTTTTLDNMRLWNSTVVDIEGMERVEVVRGLSGFLYGATDPGGVINFVTKRPTATPFATLTVGDYGIGPLTGGSGYAHADFGGPIDKDGQFAYRVNIVGQNGDMAVDQQGLQRSYFSGALDWRITPDLLAQVNVFHSYYRAQGSNPFWFFGGDARHVSAPSAQLNWAQNWAYYRNEQNGAEARVSWKLNDIFTARAAFLYINASAPRFPSTTMSSPTTEPTPRERLLTLPERCRPSRATRCLTQALIPVPSSIRSPAAISDNAINRLYRKTPLRFQMSPATLTSRVPITHQFQRTPSAHGQTRPTSRGAIKTSCSATRSIGVRRA